ncbi:SNF2-related protein [Paraburkholderia sp. J10-1]|uniref:SNF2-related protein n=1 Tax=Paraburkholderia sp. J10-1 TaxID=2805430 RepID=UPI002AB742C8|nr:SNF2-related protein [Paraburkholderia sp. J10-1]
MSLHQLLDDVRGDHGALLNRLKLAGEAARLITQRSKLSRESTADVLAALKIGKRLRELGIALGVRVGPVPVEAPQEPASTAPDAPTVAFYPDAGTKTLTQRQKDNNAAIELLRKVQAGEVAVTDAERAILAKYTGSGGGLIAADGLTGSPHEYYTPKPVAEAAWSMLKDLGFEGGTVLDPCAGTGIFTATRPPAAVMTQIELDATSGAINGAINDGPTVSTTVSPFEAIAAVTPDEIYDAVITNVPFGDLAMRGDNPLKDKRFQKRNLQEYFILRSLQKLKPRGLAVFIVPPSIVAGKGAKQRKLRLEASLMAEFIGAYRLPNKVFSESASADTITDVIAFRKFSRETVQKLDELQAQNPAVLTEARVLWDEFLDGQYFKGEGKRFVLGESARGMGKFGEVEKVINDDSVANIARMIKRFPKSRIDWALLNEAETSPIIYADGDVIHSDGRTLEWKDGSWNPIETDLADDKVMTETGVRVQTPLDAVNTGVTWEQANRWYDQQTVLGRHVDIPPWFSAAYQGLRAIGAADRETSWEAIAAGMAAMDLMQAASSTEPFNYRDAYPTLSAQLAKLQAYGNKSIGGAPKLVKDALLSIRNARLKGEFTPFWLGEILANPEAVALTPTQLYEKIKYESEDETGYVPIERLREAFSDFDPLTSNEWCLSPDGKSVTRPSDYYSGNYADFLTRANAELAAAASDEIKAKLVGQIEAAKQRLNTVDVSTMTFNLFTPYITNLQKLEFLKQYVSNDIFLTTDATGREIFDIKQSAPGKYASAEERDQYKALQRFVKGYLRNQNITSMSKSDDVEADPAREAALLRRIKEIADKAKAQFDAWARANEEIQVALHNKLNAPEALRFVEEPDTTPVDIPNFNVESFRPHPYQYAAVRHFSRRFGGLLGFDVGLGKTITALAAAQYAQSIGVKHKTVFVVPNNTLTNWAKEAGRAYPDTSDCLFVGISKGRDGADRVDNDQVRIDLNAIRENRHAKIFMTLEAFKMIPLRDETMQSYVDYLRANDDAFALAEEDEMKKRANIAAASKAASVGATGTKSGAVPYFEDMGIDSLVLDEAHNYKNSKTTSSEFKGAKYLADPSRSQRGMDMQAKAWYVRGLSPRNDGVLSLTATPVTNSPLEVYSMLTLSLGEEEVNRMYGVTGADSFMAAACDIEEREEENIVGMMRSVRVFTGLQNAGLLRRMMRSAAVIKTAEDVKADGVDISVPEAEEIATSVDIGAASFNLILKYKQDYLDATERVIEGNADDGDKLTASPFNLIRKMTRVISDPELDAGVMTFTSGADSVEAADAAIAAFNAKNIVEERDYDDPNAAPADVRTKLTKDVETGDAVTKFLITVRARRAKSGFAVELLSTDYKTQDALLKLLDGKGITPTVKVSPKLAALIANFKKEAANPRHRGQAKQIIFCDELSLHHKIRLALTQQAGVPAGKIKIVNAVSVDVAGMQAVQDGYNADGDENQFTVIIANKKAEVGINLQKGTQAIHHFTIGWTPDSIHQRNGRGVRQGNPLETVNVYHYDADGTFDAYKRRLVCVKADWIGSLMSGDSSKIAIEGDMSKEDYELLASAVGDAAAMERVNTQIAARNLRQREAANKTAQVQSLRIIEAQRDWLAKFGADVRGREEVGFSAWIGSKRSAAAGTRAKINELKDRLDGAKADLTRNRLNRQIADLTETLKAQTGVLEGLPVDSVGLPTVRSEYTAISEAEHATKAYENWMHDLTIAQRMRDEAAVSFNARARDGYSSEALAAFNDNSAAIVAGQLAVVGTFVEDKGKLLVVAKPRIGRVTALVGFDPATQNETELLRMSGATYIVPGSSAWSDAVRRAVAADEQTIRSATEGFGESSPNLYSSMVADVRDGLTIPIPSASLYSDSFCFKDPYFPYFVSSTDIGDALANRIRAEQGELVKSRNSRYVTLNDLRDLGPTLRRSEADMYKAVNKYCLAHGLRATEDDLKAISYPLSLAGAAKELGLTQEFFNALPDGVSQSKSPEDLDAWALQWFNSAHVWLTVPSLDDVLNATEMRRYREQANKLDDGRARWVALPDDEGYALREPAREAIKAAVTAGLLVEEINAASLESYGGCMPASFKPHLRELANTMFAELDAHIELKVGVEKVRASMLLPQSTRIYVADWNRAADVVMRVVSNLWPSMQQWARATAAASAVKSAGADAQAYVAALNDVSGVYGAKIGTESLTKYADRYTGQYRYEAGTYILFGLTRGSDAFRQVASPGASGLQGRTFDQQRKLFRVTLLDAQTFSDGQHVATVADLFKKLGVDLPTSTTTESA